MSRIFLVHRKPSEGAERARALLRAGHEVHVHTPADPAALRRSPLDPVVRDVLSGYSGTPLPKKLGIKAGTTVAARALAPGGGLWIAWPKKASGLETDLTQKHVRDFGLDREFVDYKICAIDETWSGLQFARRRR